MDAQHTQHELVAFRLIGLDEQAAEVRGQGNFADFQAILGDALVRGQAFEFSKQIQAPVEQLSRGLIHKLEILDALDPDCFKLQNGAAELTPQNLRRHLIGNLVIIIFCIQSETFARPFSPCPTRSLLRIGLRNGHNPQQVNIFIGVIGTDLHEPRVNDIPQPIDCDTCLCYIGGQDHPSLGGVMGSKYLVLVLMRQGGIQHQNLEVLQRKVCDGFIELLGKGQDVFFACQEDEDVPHFLLLIYLQNCVIGGLEVVFNWLEDVEDLGGVGSALDSHNRLRVEEVHKPGRLDRRGHDDQFIAASPLLLVAGSEQGHEHISVDAPLMGLIQNEDAKVFPSHQLSDRHPIGHECYFGFLASLLLETNTVANFLAHLNPHFRGHPFGQGDCADPPGLRDQDIAVQPVQKLRDLSSLATTGLSTDDGGLALVDKVDYFLAMECDWESVANFFVHC